MGIIEKIKVLEQAKSLIYINTGLDTSELEELTIPEIVEYLDEIEDSESEPLLNCIAQIDSEPIANFCTTSDIGCIRLFNNHGESILLRNYIGDGVNRIYIIEDNEDTEGLCYVASINGEWFISSCDTENKKGARIKGAFDIYTDKKFNFFFKKVKTNW